MLVKYIKYITYFTVLSQVFLLTCGRPSPSVPDGYKYLLNYDRYYKYHLHGSAWRDAVNSCKSEGGQLFYPESENQATEVANLLKIFSNGASYYWIGVSNFDSESKNDFKTVDGRPLSEVHNKWDTKWDEPNHLDKEHCVKIGSENGLWNEVCDRTLKYVCELTLNNGNNNGDSAPRDDYTYMESTKSFYKYHKTDVNWSDAVNVCKSEGSLLFYPENEEEASKVNSLLNILIEDQSPYKIWIGISNYDSVSVDDFKTVDGRPMSEVHNRWDSAWGEPDGLDSQHCVEMWTKFELWNTICSTKLGYVCKYTPNNNVISTTPIPHVTTTEKTDVTLGERNGYKYVESTKGYYKFHNNEVTWNDAVNMCQSEGGQLFYPETEQEAVDVNEVLDALHSYSTSHVWVGASNYASNSVDDFKTLDGRPLSEVHHYWDSEYMEPDQLYTEHCILMWFAYEIWNYNCADENAFICKLTQITSTPIPVDDTFVTKPTANAYVAQQENSNGSEGSNVLFGNVIADELKKLPRKEKLQAMAAILKVLEEQWGKVQTGQTCDHINETIQ